MQDKELNIEDLISLITTFIKRNLVFLIGFFVVGVALAFYKYSNAAIEYKTNVYIVSKTIPLELIKNEVNSAKNLLKERNYSLLKSKLGLADEQVYAIVDIDYTTISETERMLMLDFTCLNDVEINKSIRKQLKAILNENPFVGEYIEEATEEFTTNIDIYIRELKNLETLQSRILSENKSANNGGIISDPSILSNLIVQTKKEIRVNQKKLDKVSVYQEINEVTIEKHPSLSMFLFKWLVLVLFVGFVLLILLRMFFIK